MLSGLLAWYKIFKISGSNLLKSSWPQLSLLLHGYASKKWEIYFFFNCASYASGSLLIVGPQLPGSSIYGAIWEDAQAPKNRKISCSIEGSQSLLPQRAHWPSTLLSWTQGAEQGRDSRSLSLSLSLSLSHAPLYLIQSFQIRLMPSQMLWTELLRDSLWTKEWEVGTSKMFEQQWVTGGVS